MMKTVVFMSRMLTVIGLVAMACSKEKEKVVIVEYDKQGAKTNTEVSFHTKTENSILQYYYLTDDDKPIEYSFSKTIDQDSVFYVFGEDLVLVDTKEYEHEGMKAEVQKFKYAEDLIFFFNKDYGPVILKAATLNKTIEFEKLNDPLRFLIDTIKRDSAHFGGA